MYKSYKIYKPFGVLSQFTKEHDKHRVLGELHNFSKDIYPIGRLDRDSEGLLLLSSDKTLTDKILNPKNKWRKTYWVQVEGQITKVAIQSLKEGVEIKIKTGKYFTTSPCEISTMDSPAIPDRIPPIRERKTVPTSWATITISEGKNRQVRKMFAAVGFPVLRLIRYSIGNINIENMAVGEVIELEKVDILR